MCGMPHSSTMISAGASRPEAVMVCRSMGDAVLAMAALAGFPGIVWAGRAHASDRLGYGPGQSLRRADRVEGGEPATDAGDQAFVASQIAKQRRDAEQRAGVAAAEDRLFAQEVRHRMTHLDRAARLVHAACATHPGGEGE